MTVRIVGGSFGSRKLFVPKGDSTRPTQDRVKEALFNIWGDLSELSFLDLFAGSGAIGFEALSRGAKYVTFVESEKQAQACILKNADILKLKEHEFQLQAFDVTKALKQMNIFFDRIFLDPPYAIDENTIQIVLELVCHRVHPSAKPQIPQIVLEFPKGREIPKIPKLTVMDQRNYGDTALWFLCPT